MHFEEIIAHLFKGWRAKPSVSNHSVSDAQKELENSYNKTKKDFEESYIATVKEYDFATNIVLYALKEAESETGRDYKKLPESVVSTLVDVTVGAVKHERFFNFHNYDFSREIPLSRQIEIKHYLEKVKLRVYDDDEMLLCFHISFGHALKHYLLAIQTLTQIPSKDDSFALDISYALENVGVHIEQMVIAFFTDKNAQYGIFETVREQLLNNADIASGFPSHRTSEERNTKPCILPEKSKLLETELVDAYLGDTYLTNLFDTKIDFTIPLDLRFEHCHILAGTGHGKTQLLQKLILDDIQAERGFMVIDSQGDMIAKIAMLKVFDPEAYDSLSDKLIIIDPEDVDYPVSLNMFSLDTGSGDVSNLQKQMLVNSTVDLYEYMFGALFGSELTSKQGVIFRYVAKLMAEIPGATIHTLRELMEDGKQYQEYIDRLDGSARAFFATQFFTTTFGQTKKQILSRLWAVLSNQTLENLFSSKKNSVNIFEAIQDGKIVLVNTSKKLLQASGSQLLGRFFIALTAQAVIKRGTVPEHLRTPYMVYIDEAQEYFDEKIDEMLNQARKMKVAFTLSHQNLNQLGGLKATMFSSTSVKLAGGISAKDATDMAHEMKSKPDFLLGMQKTKTHAEFACYLKNQITTSIPLSFLFGTLESKDVMSVDSYEQLIDSMRAKYCSHVSELSYGSIPTAKKKAASQVAPDIADKTPPVKEVGDKTTLKVVVDKKEEQKPKSDIPPPVQPETAKNIPADTVKSVVPEQVEVAFEGKGGSVHRYLQNLVKKIGQQRGFHTVVESPVFSGLGAVDVALNGFDTNIAVEVSVHTQGKWESSNIAKCLSADFDYVIIIASEKTHLDKVQLDISDEFSEQIESGKLQFFQSEQLIKFLDEIKANSATQESKVFGYKITTSFAVADEKETQIREEAIAKVLLNKK